MPNRSKWLLSIADFLIDNIAILLTIGFAGFVIYRQEIAQIAVSTEELLTAILGVLALLATSEVIERYRRINSIQRSSSRILSLLESRFTDRPSAMAFFQKPPNPEPYVQRSSQIDLCGVTLTSAINKQFSNLRERLKEGASIRILVADPDSLALTMSASRSESPEDIGYYGKRLEATFNDIKYLHESWKELQQLDNTPKKGSFSVRLLSYAPSFGVSSFDANRATGIVFVELFTHKSGFRSPPTFDLTAQRDGEWYKFFTTQFEEMWQSAKEWSPKPPQSTQKPSP
ncbi:MAG: hypothetical protein M3R61_04535 [Chloroflexota bacterium]|nr:hypothetical protein [Chloroflexota bacterium]